MNLISNDIFSKCKSIAKAFRHSYTLRALLSLYFIQHDRPNPNEHCFNSVSSNRDVEMNLYKFILHEHEVGRFLY